jgi:Mg-chelatase subunit ChlD
MKEVAAVRSAIDDEAVMAAIPEGMASDVALFGSKAEVLERAEAWEAAGITHLVLDCTSARRSLRGRLRGYGGLHLGGGSQQ